MHNNKQGGKSRLGVEVPHPNATARPSYRRGEKIQLCEVVMVRVGSNTCPFYINEGYRLKEGASRTPQTHTVCHQPVPLSRGEKQSQLGRCPLVKVRGARKEVVEGWVRAQRGPLPCGRLLLHHTLSSQQQPPPPRCPSWTAACCQCGTALRTPLPCAVRRRGSRQREEPWQ